MACTSRTLAAWSIGLSLLALVLCLAWPFLYWKTYKATFDVVVASETIEVDMSPFRFHVAAHGPESGSETLWFGGDYCYGTYDDDDDAGSICAELTTAVAFVTVTMVTILAASIVASCASCGSCECCDQQRCPHITLLVLYGVAGVCAVVATTTFSSTLKSHAFVSSFDFFFSEIDSVPFVDSSIKTSHGSRVGWVLMVLAIAGATLSAVALFLRNHQQAGGSALMLMDVPGVTAPNAASSAQPPQYTPSQGGGLAQKPPDNWQPPQQQGWQQQSQPQQGWQPAPSQQQQGWQQQQQQQPQTQLQPQQQGWQQPPQPHQPQPQQGWQQTQPQTQQGWQQPSQQQDQQPPQPAWSPQQAQATSVQQVPQLPPQQSWQAESTNPAFSFSENPFNTSQADSQA